MNKEDLLEERLRKHDLRKVCPEFTGDPTNPEEAKKFMAEQCRNVLGKIKEQTGWVSVHFTSALDTEATNRVFQNVLQTVMRKQMQQLGLQ